ncbi:neprilysin-2-like, partial [Stegodyphus dumicola]|uniref:neprilysin-2-like n=1 Tax=Stegodyphus dumicola TaxID=202533 RepID=UPI0015A765A0
VRSITSHTVYPKELLNDSLVSDVYKDLKINIIHYYKNSLKVLKWATDYSYSQLRKPNKRGDWKKYSRSTVTHGTYNIQDNVIELPAGIFEKPIFSRNRPRYLNFGSIGSHIGHEIAHAFSYKGRLFDIDGNKRNWFDRADENALINRTQCFVEQYNNYTAGSEIQIQVNGVKTLEENIADITGLKASYQAYQTWVKHHGREPKLPGLKYTPNQLFWISSANMFCARMDPSTLEDIMSADKHSPHEFRIIGPLSNLPEFAKDFNCKPDSAMVRKNRCEFW